MRRHVVRWKWWIAWLNAFYLHISNHIQLTNDAKLQSSSVQSLPFFLSRVRARSFAWTGTWTLISTCQAMNSGFACIVIVSVALNMVSSYECKPNGILALNKLNATKENWPRCRWHENIHNIHVNIFYLFKLWWNINSKLLEIFIGLQSKSNVWINVRGQWHLSSSNESDWRFETCQ